MEVIKPVEKERKKKSETETEKKPVKKNRKKKKKKAKTEQGANSIETKLGLQNHSSFGLRFPTPRKSQKWVV